MSRTTLPHRSLAIACRLEQDAAARRVEEWRDLRHKSAVAQEPIVNGQRLWLRPEAEPQALALAQRESGCCPFLDIELEAQGDRLRLDLCSPNPDAAPIIAGLLGGESDSGGQPC